MSQSEITAGIECLTETRCELGESPLWDSRLGRLWWVDIEGRAVHAFDEADGREQRFALDKRPTALGLTEDPGELVLALEDGVYLWRWPGTPRLLASIEADVPSTRCNDAKIGPDGWFWVGTIDERSPRQPAAALYRVSPAAEVQQIEAGLTVSNGLAWSADGRTQYHADTGAAWLDRHDFDPSTGERSGRLRIATPTNEDGRPDGGACDIDGNYWSAGVSAGCLNRYARDGTLRQRVAVPVVAPTMPCFGGPDLRTLYFTSLRAGRDPDALASYPESGAVHRMPLTTPGVPAFIWGRTN